MKKWLIKIAKKNAVLYRIAKKLYRSVRPAAPTLYRSQDYFMVYQLHALEEMDDILQHYAQVPAGQYPHRRRGAWPYAGHPSIDARSSGRAVPFAGLL